MPSVKLTLDHVNEHKTVLRNYRLHMWWNDTECNAAVGVKSFFDMTHSGPHKLMLFGAACTHVTDPIAKASKHWHLTQLSYADTHPMFMKEAFPNFFRIVPSDNSFNLPRLALLKLFNWTRVGTIYQNEPRYALVRNQIGYWLLFVYTSRHPPPWAIGSNATSGGEGCKRFHLFRSYVDPEATLIQKLCWPGTDDDPDE